LTLKDEQLLGFLVRDDAMAPVLRPGQWPLVAAAERPPAGELGRDALVGLADGRRLLRRLGRAPTRGVSTSPPTTRRPYLG
jgi:hypothetical protein